MEQMHYDKAWEKIEKHGVPCKVTILCVYKPTYTGPGIEYTPLWSIKNNHIPVQLEELRRGKGNVLWGRTKNGDGWIDLKDAELYEE